MKMKGFIGGLIGVIFAVSIGVVIYNNFIAV